VAALQACLFIQATYSRTPPQPATCLAVVLTCLTPHRLGRLCTVPVCRMTASAHLPAYVQHLNTLAIRPMTKAAAMFVLSLIISVQAIVGSSSSFTIIIVTKQEGVKPLVSRHDGSLNMDACLCSKQVQLGNTYVHLLNSVVSLRRLLLRRLGGSCETQRHHHHQINLHPHLTFLLTAMHAYYTIKAQ
jgi:hypothetical protein